MSGIELFRRYRRRRVEVKLITQLAKHDPLWRQAVIDKMVIAAHEAVNDLKVKVPV